MLYKKFSITNTGGTILFIIVGIFLYNILNGLMLNFTGLNQTSLLSKFSEIHFSSPGNDFGGGVFWLPMRSLSTPQTITANGTNKSCYKQLRGIYYNAARGARLWPLDKETLDLLNSTGGQGYGNLQITGGLYTSCGSSADQYGIFGVIEYTWGGTVSYIIAGTKLNYQQNYYTSEFAHTFEYFNNVTPLGFLWDSVGGIGFVGGAIAGSENLLDYLNTTGSISNSFLITGSSIDSSSGSRSVNLTGDSQAKDTMWNILIQGSVVLTKATNIYEQRALLGNLEKRTILINSDINSATVINLAKKNAEVLCRGKTYLEGGASTTLPLNNQEKVLCYKNTDNLDINLSDTLHKDKTIIVKNGNITLLNTMSKDSPALDIFIDGGNLLIKNPVATKTNFNQDGYPAEASVTNSGIFIKGNFVINGLLLGNNTALGTFGIENKVHLLGKLAFLNTPTTPSQGRITQVNNVLGTGAFEERISLENIFTWSCELSGTGSDGTNCYSPIALTSSAIVTPFVVLNANYPSNIIK
ncbi:hypothetical protein P148_SR1C00001G0117 [candidate division SR1 bacterium RAAC1_SR1_1]|nr:hypothetical protein P148_SR1C00001G0117 [candidate division SR1 bacterium RAAC1_SR1_1]